MSFIKRNENVTDEDFRKNWEKEHSQKMLPLLKKYGALYYSQTYISHDGQRAISQSLFEDKSRTLDYDGIATIVFPSLQAAEDFSKDTEHSKTVKDDPKVWIQAGAARIMAGEEVVFLNQISSK
ncbi:4511_t:CDS:2 [Acaulospora colombiana]|uniref:4511_t:CDS:1 n=1 Tax=Acaulospora colombiana TaxID=27376 RepID=A0ACA9NZ71_9GLOM|nr:4511_t:CDS:2 [Acaulospora colombiana]